MRPRKTYITEHENCPRCKFNDLVTQITHGRFRSDNVLDWYRRNTIYTEEQLKNCTHECNRCSIVFIVKKMEILN